MSLSPREMTEALTTSSPKPNAEPPKRSCLGCAFKGGLGCMAFFVGVVFILALIGPGFLADKIAGGIRDDFNDSHQGTLEIEAYELAWTEPQHVRGVRLLDPEGQPVLNFSMQFPGIFAVFQSLGSDSTVFNFGRVVGEVSGAIVVDDSGRSNLARALDPSESTRKKYESRQRDPAPDPELEQSLAEMLEKLEFVLEVKSPSLTYSDPRTRALGTEVAVRNLELQVRTRARGSWTLNANADLLSEKTGRMDIRVTARDPDWGNSEWPLGELALGVDLRDVSTDMIDGMLAQEGRLAEAFGPLLSLDLNAEDVTANAGRVDLEVRSQRQELTMGGRFEEGQFVMRETDRLAWSLEPPRSLIEPHLAAALPPEFQLALAEGGGRWQISLHDLAVPVLGDEPESSASEITTDERLQAMLSGASFNAQFNLGGLNLERVGSGSVSVRNLVVSARQSSEGLVGTVAFGAASAPLGPGNQLAPFAIEVRPRNPWSVALGDGDLLAWEADVTFAEVALRSLLTALGIEDERLALLEGPFIGDLRVRDGRNASARLDGELGSKALSVKLNQLISDEDHLVRSGQGDALTIEADGAALSETIRTLLPEGVSVTLPAGMRRLVVESVSAPVLERGSHDPDLAQLAAQLRFELGQIGVAMDETKQVVLSDARGSVTLPSSGPPKLEITSGLVRHANARIRIEATANSTWSELLQLADPEQARFQLDLSASDIPSALVDEFAEQDGLIVDVLGPTLDLTCKSPALGLSSGPLVVHMNSELGTFDWSGRLEAGALISSGEEHLEAKVGLSPLFNKRIIGSLVPLLVEAKKQPGAAPVFLSLRESSLPLGGDLSGLSGKLRLDLGAIQYRILPQLEEFLGKPLQSKDRVIAPIDIEIVNGIARYEGLAIHIGDKSYDFTGSIALATQALDFETTVPLGNLGSKVDKSVTRLIEQGLLSPNVAVPITLGGTVNKPRVGLKDGFIGELTKDLVPSALEGLLKKGLDKLLKDH